MNLHKRSNKYSFLSIFVFGVLLQLMMAASVGPTVEMEVLLNNELTKVTVGDLSAYATGDFLLINGKNYTFGPSWTFFGLRPAKEITVHKWDVKAECPAIYALGNSKCKDDCFGLKNCNDTFFNPNACFGLYSESHTVHKTYSLYISKTIALTSYGGPSFPVNPLPLSQQPGWTIKQTREIQNYSHNVAIRQTIPRNEFSLADFKYVQGKGLMTTEAVELLKEELPTINASMKGSTLWCDRFLHGLGYPVSLSYKLTYSSIQGAGIENKFTSFRDFVILRQPNVSNITTLHGKRILGLREVETWNANIDTFFYLDPCQEKFLRLTYNRTDQRYYIFAPPLSTLLLTGVFCVAIQEDSLDNEDLVLYESQNGSTIWTNSSQFTGILSPNYLEALDLRITTKSNLTFGAIEAQIRASVHRENQKTNNNNNNNNNAADARQVILTLSTSIPLKCKVTLSQFYTVDLETTITNPILYHVIPQVAVATHFDAKGSYNCAGIFGEFSIPSDLVEVPLSELFVETTVAGKTTDTLTDSWSMGGSYPFSLLSLFNGGFGNFLSNIGPYFNGLWHAFSNWLAGLAPILKVIVISIIIGLIILLFIKCLPCIAFGGELCCCLWNSVDSMSNNVRGKLEERRKEREMKKQKEASDFENQSNKKKRGGGGGGTTSTASRVLKNVPYGEMKEDIETSIAI